MKPAVTTARIFTGLLFIFSGLVKANDPLGLSYKMQEFFEIWGLHQFNGYSLILSVVLNAFEIIAGFALLLGWRIRVFSWLLLLLILFFTFLTGYTYVTGKPTNCGCFGDCLPITSKTSFLKDVLLTVLIGFMFWKQQLIRPVLPDKANTLAMLGVILFSFGFQWYTLTNLPVVDCLPFKKGNNIAEKRKMPANAIPDSTVITFVYAKDGKEIEFTADKFPADFNADTYKFVKRYDRLVRKGSNNEPPIKGFVLSGETNADSTEYVLEQPYALLLFIEKVDAAGTGWQKTFTDLYTVARQKNIPCFLVTADLDAARTMVSHTGFSGITVFKCDYKAIETAARSNPCLYLLNKGTVLAKYSGKNFRKMSGQLNETPAQAPPPMPPAVTPADSTANAN